MMQVWSLLASANRVRLVLINEAPAMDVVQSSGAEIPLPPAPFPFSFIYVQATLIPI